MKKILVIEDEKSLNEAIRMKLVALGVKPIAVTTASEAFEILEKEKPDLIWLDVLLPDMNGIDFLEKLRNDPQYKDIKVAIVSVSGGFEAKERAMRLGVADYIVKSQYPLEIIVKRMKDLA